MTNLTFPIPHTPPMLMLSDIEELNQKSLRTSVRIGVDNPFVEKGRFLCAGAIELFAQAAGVLLGQSLSGSSANQDSQQPASLAGAVVQLKQFELGEIHIPPGSDLQVSAHFLAGTAQAGMMEGEVNFDNQTVFKGTLMIALFKDQSND